MDFYLKLLQRYGEKLDLDEHSLTNAMTLAKGKLPIVILMQEPCNLADTAPYDIMIYGDESEKEWSPERIGCPSLQEVEAHIEEVTNGEYGLEDVSIFDLNALMSRNLQEESPHLDKDVRLAHELTWDMITAKSPKVILVLTCSAGQSGCKRLTLLGTSLKRAGTTRNIMFFNGGHKKQATIVRGFHPSVYLREDYTDEECWTKEDIKLANEVLRHCFTRAFAAMSGGDTSTFDEDELLDAWKVQLARKSGLPSLEEEFSSKLSLH